MTPALTAYLRDLTTRCEQATKGPWGVEISSNTGRTVRVVHSVGTDGLGDDICRLGDLKTPGHRPNADMIAHARTDLPRLVRLVRDAHAALERIARGDSVVKGLRPELAGHARRIAIQALARVEAMVKEGG